MRSTLAPSWSSRPRAKRRAVPWAPSPARRLFATTTAVLAAAIAAPLAAAPVAVGPPPMRVESDSLDPASLDRAVEALVDGLLAAKDPNSFWEPKRVPADESSTQAFGWTAIVLLALVESGVSPQDPRIADAVAALATARLEGTYAVAVRTMLGATLPDRHRPMLEGDVRWLLDGFSRRSRGWDYVKRPNSAREDNSINQFASLAISDAAGRGIEVPNELWSLLEARTLAMQRPDGGWTYEGRGEPRGSMTAAGVATLFMLDRQLDPRRRERRAAADAVERGLAWLSDRFDPDRNPGHALHELYWLFSLERAALAGGISRLGRRDWFREGAASIIERLCEIDADGTWRLRTTTPRGRAIRWHEHALGLLFLLRGRTPVALGVLAESGEDALTAGRFAGELSEWMGDTAEREFNWLRLDPDDAVDTWLEPALMWWSPDSATRIDGDEAFRTRLRRFVDLGGLLVVDLGALDPRQRRIVRDRLGQLRAGATWRELDDEHPAVSSLFRIPPRRFGLETLSDGVRDLVVLDDSGRLARGLGAGPIRGIEARRILLNLWMLSVETDRSWPRLRRWTPPEQDTPSAASPRLRLIDLQLEPASTGPEPEAPPFMRRAIGERLRGTIDLRRIALESADSLLATAGDGDVPTILLLRGVVAPEWSEARWNALAELVREGRVLLVETVGGRGEFATAVERELAARLERTVVPLVGDPLLAGDESSGRADLRRSAYRPSTARRTGAGRSACRLRGLRLTEPEPRPAVADGEAVSQPPLPPPEVVFSTLDLSHAMLGRPREGLDGYATASAIELLDRIASDLIIARDARSVAAP